ncbi:hypothetical protein MHYP_G00099480 [Metynnis hypsauchen]
MDTLCRSGNMAAAGSAAPGSGCSPLCSSRSAAWRRRRGPRLGDRGQTAGPAAPVPGTAAAPWSDPRTPASSTAPAAGWNGPRRPPTCPATPARLVKFSSGAGLQQQFWLDPVAAGLRCSDWFSRHGPHGKDDERGLLRLKATALLNINRNIIRLSGGFPTLVRS